MPRKTNTQILKKIGFSVKAVMNKNFFRYLNSDALSFLPGFSNDFQVIDFGRNSEFPQKIGILKKMEGSEKLKSLFVICDPEINAETACNEMQHALHKNDLPVPAKPCLFGRANSKSWFCTISHM